MDIKIAEEKDYIGAIRDLFPKGEYWERQFTDPKSDVNLFCKAKAQKIINFRRRMNDLLMESKITTSDETIADWERVIMGYTSEQLPLSSRKNILGIKTNTIINRLIISETARKYGLILIDIVFPFKPSFFGFSKFGHSLFSRPAFYSFFYIITTSESDVDAETLKNYEQDVEERLLSGNIAYFLYK